MNITFKNRYLLLQSNGFHRLGVGASQTKGKVDGLRARVGKVDGGQVGGKNGAEFLQVGGHGLVQVAGVGVEVQQLVVGGLCYPRVRMADCTSGKMDK